MSIYSEEEENELINFENLKILDLFEDDSEIEYAECIDINSDKKKIILIKMSNTEKIKDAKSIKNSNKSKSLKSNVKVEEIHEVKYNLYLGLYRDCVPAIKECEKVINNRNLIGRRIVIQQVEKSNGQNIFHPKKYIFIPPNESKELFFEIGGNEFLKVKKGKNISMELCKKVGEKFEKEKDLKEFDEKTGPDILNKNDAKKNDESSEYNKSPLDHFSTTINSKVISLGKDTQQNKININCDKTNETSGSIKDGSGIEVKSDNTDNNKSKITDDSILSRLDQSSENELDEGKLFYDEIEKGTKYMKYSFKDLFKKEIDGVYYKHSAINLGIGKVELKYEDYKNYQSFEKDYKSGNKNNDLHACIIMKNFDELTIPENTPFIIEIKKGFDFITLLKQLKKTAKFVTNMKNYNSELPKYFIGILCSFKDCSVEGQFKQLNTIYNGSDSEDKGKSTLFNHITKIINFNKIKFVIAVIQDGIINGYNLGEEDYNINYQGKNYQRVDLFYMYKTIINENPQPNELEKIKNVTNNFSQVFETFNKDVTCEISMRQKIEQENKIKEYQEEKKKFLEEAEKRKKTHEEEKRKLEEERKQMQKIQEEEKRKLEEERKQMQKIQEEEMKKLEEELKRKLEEERKQMQKIQEEEKRKLTEEKRKLEEELKKIQKIQEEEMKKLEEEKKKIQEEMKKIEGERKKKSEEEEKKAKEHKSKSDQDSEHHEEEKKKKKKRNKSK